MSKVLNYYYPTRIIKILFLFVEKTDPKKEAEAAETANAKKNHAGDESDEDESSDKDSEGDSDEDSDSEDSESEDGRTDAERRREKAVARIHVSLLVLVQILSKCVLVNKLQLSNFSVVYMLVFHRNEEKKLRKNAQLMI